MNNIPLVDLRRQYLSIKSEIDEAIQDVIDRSAFISGKYLRKFEEEFASFCGVKYAVGTSSGTTALYMALQALNIGRGDEVITVPYTFIATAEAIVHVGATPVFVDIDPESFNIDPELIEKVITDRTKAIIPVDLYGQIADMEKVLQIAEKYNLKVIEDACQAHGARYRGKRAGSFGDMGVFSFYPGKNLGAYGDAGIVVTDSEELYKKLRLLSDHGRKSKYEHVILGYNFRMDGLQSAILSVKLKYIDSWNSRRRILAGVYNSFFANYDISVQRVINGNEHIYHLYVIRNSRRDEILKKLKQSGISAGIHYPISLHEQPAFKFLGYKKGDFPVSERCCDEVLSLPMFPELTEDEVEKISKTVISVL